MHRNISLSFLFFGLFIVLFACAGPNVKLMVPVVKPAPEIVIDKTLKVAEVTGERDKAQKSPRFKMSKKWFASNQQVKEALVKGIGEAGIFRTVVTDGESDLELKANIISQYFKDPYTLNTRNEIIINYKIIEVNSKNLIWQDTFQADFGSTDFGGAKRFHEACEGAVRENIALFLKEVCKQGGNLTLK